MVIRVSGTPAFVTAHRISVTDEELEFELAYLFTTLVLQEHGGPRPIKARAKKQYFHLAEKGWVHMEGESFYADDSVTQVVWTRVRESRFPVVVTSPPKIVGSKRDRWWALATIEGVDRVNKAWRDHKSANRWWRA